jgi:hypothetical protein
MMACEHFGHICTVAWTQTARRRKMEQGKKGNDDVINHHVTNSPYLIPSNDTFGPSVIRVPLW